MAQLADDRAQREIRPPGVGTPDSHPLFARLWSRASGRVVSNRHRAALLEGLSGRALEVGAGDGRNFAHYPPGVDELIAVEPEPYLRAAAERRAAAAPVPVIVRDGTAERIPAEDGSCDAAVASLVLCSVADQRAALDELRRVIVPGGELRFFEHVRAGGTVGRALQGGLDGSGVWPRLGGGCHLSRDTVAAIARAGFTVQRMRRFASGPGSLGVPFVLGCARAPS